MSKVKLICGGKEETPHVHRQKVGAVTASNCDCLEQTRARNTHLQNSFHYFIIIIIIYQ